MNNDSSVIPAPALSDDHPELHTAHVNLSRADYAEG